MIVCGKCYNQRTQARRKQCKENGAPAPPQPTTATGTTDSMEAAFRIREAALSRQLRRSEAGRKAALRQIAGTSRNGKASCSCVCINALCDSFDAGWNSLTAPSTRYKYIKETADFITAKAKEPALLPTQMPTDLEEAVIMEPTSAPKHHPIAVAMGDLIGSKRIRPYMEAALQRAKISAPMSPAAPNQNADSHQSPPPRTDSPDPVLSLYCV